MDKVLPILFSFGLGILVVFFLASHPLYGLPVLGLSVLFFLALGM